MTEQQDDVPVAIVGFSINFPKEATSSAAFWRMLVEGKSARSVVPPQRFNIDGYYCPDDGHHDTVQFKEGHFLNQDLASFDAPFFSITPAEAASMDPQQRCLLETSYRAFENAGIPMEQLIGSNTSVHVGSLSHDWISLLTFDDTRRVDYDTTGSGFSFLANRLSWFYDLKGPSLSLDTACSSSMMALHLACQGLKNGEAQMGLVGGANIIVDPGVMVSMSNMGMLSPDGICYSFDERANGYSRGEGIGVVIIKLLDQALRDGDTIRGIIRATGSNQDGKTPSITQPNEGAQERLIRNIYTRAGLDRRMTRYFEAHGTGTRAGDPKEAHAIAAAFMDERPAGEPLFIGTIKTNLGHLEGASGIAGLIKALLVLENGLIPRSLWFENVNPAIHPKNWNIEFPTKNIPWPTSGLRRASVNSFGFGGTNVHAVLDDVYNYLKLRGLIGNHCTFGLPPSHPTLNETHSSIERLPKGILEHGVGVLPKVFVFSAADEATLSHLLSLFIIHMSELGTQFESEDYLSDLAYTLSARRSALRWRSYAVSDSLSQLSRVLVGGLERSRSTNPRNAGFIFTGQGAQWPSMGRELKVFPAFQKSLQTSQQILEDLGCDWSLFDTRWDKKRCTDIHKPEYSQPACTALQIALVDLLRQWNLNPCRIIGHSSGEIAAAYCAGLLEQHTAVKIAFYRGLLSATLADPTRHPGAMLAVMLPETVMKRYLCELEHSFRGIEVEVACINSPNKLTMSGSEEQIDALKVILDRSGTASKKLKIGVAYHSKAMNEIAHEYKALIGDVPRMDPAENHTLMFSTVTGGLVSADEVCCSEYWVQNLTSQVRFSESLAKLCSSYHPSNSREESSLLTDLVEIGPHSALASPVKDVLASCVPSRNISYSSVLIRGVSAIESSFSAMGRLYSFGYLIDLMSMNQCKATNRNPQTLSDLPEYPFNHTGKHWAEGRLFENYRCRTQVKNKLLGTPVSDWNPLQPRWRCNLRADEMPWIMDHKVNGVELYPAAGMLVMAIEAARQLAKGNHQIAGYTLSDIKFLKPLMSVSDAKDFEIQVSLKYLQSNDDDPSRSKEFSIYTVDKGSWVENCRGNVEVGYEAENNEVDEGREAEEEIQYLKEIYRAVDASCKRRVRSKDLYNGLKDVGIEYGPTFQVLEDVRSGRDDAVAQVRLGQWATSSGEDHNRDHVIHPSELDGILQLSFPAFQGKSDRRLPTLIPERMQYLWISARGLKNLQNNSAMALARVDIFNSRGAELSLTAMTEGADELRVDIRGFKATNLQTQDHRNLLKEAQWRRLCFNFDWRPDLQLLRRQELQNYCSAKSNTGTRNRAMVSDAEYICFVTILNTLENLDHKPLKTTDRLHLRKYTLWMKLQAERYNENQMIHWRSDWVRLSKDSHHNECVLNRVRDSSAEGRLYAQVAMNLINILEGRIDALELLFESSLAADFYHEIAAMQIAPLEPFLDGLAHKIPGLMILEIGAGTGGSTLPMLNILQPSEMRYPRYERYTFTDISAGFFGKAQEKFEAHSVRMTFATLNIETDPLQQGFSEGAYDLVLAANVLHATRHLDEALRNVRRLLKPGGHLVLCELQNDALASISFVFGLLPGWWLSTRSDSTSGPLLSEESWQEIICRNGFSGPNLLCHDHEDPGVRLGHAMVFTAIETPCVPPEIPGLTFIIAQGSDLQRTVARKTGAQLDTEYSDIELHMISPYIVDQKLCVIMLEIEDNFLQNVSEVNFARLQLVVKSATGILWVRHGGVFKPDRPEIDLVLGLSRCVRSEKRDIRFITLGLQDTANTDTVAHHITDIVHTTLLTSAEDCEAEYEENAGILYINRLVEANEMNDHIYRHKQAPKLTMQTLNTEKSALKLDVGVLGSLDSMRYITDCQTALAEDEVEIKVKAVGVNFKDILMALGRLPEVEFGSECAGTVSCAGSKTNFVTGDRVCAVTIGAYRTHVRAKEATILKISDSMSFAESASLSIVFATAYHALFDIARLQAGESVLIHSGAGGTGQAAIQLAKLLKAKIFVTVGSEKKKKLLMDLYNVPETHIFSSRGPTFAKGLKRVTQGKGVDVVLNSLSGTTLLLSWSCLAPFGRFIEIGRRDILQGNQLPMLPLDRNRSFAAINLEHMLCERPNQVRRIMTAVLDLARQRKISSPHPLHVYPASEVEDAFRYLQGGTSTGKTVVEVRDDDLVAVLPDSRPKNIFDRKKTYVITGGLGGLGRRITRWMVDLGAKNLILVSRSGTSSEQARDFLREMQTLGINIATPVCDIGDKSSLACVVTECANKMPPVKGCIQAAMVLQDSLFETMSPDVFKNAIRPKVDGSWNLHKLLPRDLDFFILLSSSAGVAGYRGQSNYAAGNTYQNALARYRVSRGEKAVSLDLGAITSSGYVAERPEVQAHLERLGLPPMLEEELLQLLKYYCDPDLDVLTPSQAQIVTGIDTPANLKAKNIEEPYWLRKSQFKGLYQMDHDSSTASITQSSPEKGSVLVAAASSLEDAAEIASTCLLQKLSKIMCKPVEDIDANQPPHKFGVDSLVAVELKNWFVSEFGVDVQVFEILGKQTIAELGINVARKVRLEE